jgi:hypothetical protein
MPVVDFGQRTFSISPTRRQNGALRDTPEK